jgi:hypothetical protein
MLNTNTLLKRSLLVGAALVASSLACALPFGSNLEPGELYKDDFSSESSGWSHSTDDTGSLEYEEGEYVFRINESQYITWGLLDEEEFENIRVEVEVAERNQASNDQPTFGVMCHYQDSNNYYYAGFGTDGYYAVIKYENGEDFFLSDPAENLWQPTEDISGGQEKYKLEVECANGNIKLIVDGKTISEVEDSTFSKGQIGLFVLTFDEPEAHIAFDNIRVLDANFKGE